MPQINRLYFWFRNYFCLHFPHTYCVCNKRKSAVKFFIAGSFAAATDLLFLFLFHGVFHWSIVPSTSLAFVLSFFVSFTLQKFWTFRNFSHDKAVSQFVLYILNALIGLNLNGYFMHMLVNRYQVWYILAQIIVNVAIGAYNFIIYKSIVFKIGKNETRHEQKIIESGARDMA
ncbi:MAG: GtrA family protein [Candidatus Falkowbacteria bacterium]